MIDKRNQYSKDTVIYDCGYTLKDIAESYEDEYGVKYSQDGKRLLKASFNFLKDQDEIESYTVKEGTEIICDWAFQGIRKLKGITLILPNSLKCIGNHAFDDCQINSINFPKSLQHIGDGAFANSVELTNIELPNSLKSIGCLAFHNCDKLTKLTLPRSVTHIGGGAFSGCNIDLEIKPDKFKSDGVCLIDISTNTLVSCIHEITEDYTVSSYIRNIAEYCFCGGYITTKTISINIPESVNYIGDGAFSGGSFVLCIDSSDFTLTNDNLLIERSTGRLICITKDPAFGKIIVTIPDNVKEICNYAFYYRFGISEIIIPTSVVFIGNNSFEDCEYLNELVIPESVTNLGNKAFKSCGSLEKIILPESITEIGTMTFWCCSKLKSIDIPNAVTEIGKMAFEHCENLESLIIPNSVKVIGDRAFNSCKKLSEVIIPPSVITLGNKVFENCCSLKAIYIPSSVKDIGFGAFPDGAEIHIDNQNEIFDDKCIINPVTHTLISCIDKETEEYSIPENVESIAPKAFIGCKNLKSIIIPDSVKTIGYSAFRECNSLLQIELPDSISSIGPYAFYRCYSLKNIHLPLYLTKIDYYTFAYCESLERINIPQYVKSIGSNAFLSCESIKEITLPEALMELGDHAFLMCKSLKKITMDYIPIVGKDPFCSTPFLMGTKK